MNLIFQNSFNLICHTRNRFIFIFTEVEWKKSGMIAAFRRSIWAIRVCTTNLKKRLRETAHSCKLWWTESVWESSFPVTWWKGFCCHSNYARARALWSLLACRCTAVFRLGLLRCFRLVYCSVACLCFCGWLLVFFEEIWLIVPTARNLH